MLQLLLWQKAVARRNELLHGSWRKRIQWLVGMALGAAFVYFVFTVSIVLFRWLLAYVPAAVTGLITGGFTLLSTFALFWGIGSVLSDLYLASDLELLLAAPVSSSAIFWLKLLGAMWQSAVPALLPVTMLLAYGIAASAGPTYYLGVVAVLLLLLASLSAVAMSLVMLLMRVMPAQRAREIYSLFYIIFFAAMWLGWMMLSGSGSRGGQIFSRYGPQLAATGSRLALPPASWAGQMMLAWAQGLWGQVAGYSAVLILFGALTVGLAYWLFQRSFHQDWATMHEVAGRSRRRPENGHARIPIAPGQRLAGWLPWPARELAGKDWITIPRDLRQLSRLIMPLVVSLFYVYQFGYASPIQRELPGATFWLMLLIMPVVPLFFALALGTPSIGKEGSNFELLRVAPISPGSLLWGKVWMAALPTALIGLLVVLAESLLLRLSPLQFLALALLTCLFSAIMSIVAVAFGAVAPNFHSQDYRRAVGPLASYGTMLVSAVVWFAALMTLGAVAIHLPSGHALAAGLHGRLETARPVYLLLTSPWILLGVLLIDALVCTGLALLWTYATHRIAAWQPAE